MDTKGVKLQWGGDGGVLNWAIGIDMYTLMCIKLMTDLKKKDDFHLHGISFSIPSLSVCMCP